MLLALCLIFLIQDAGYITRPLDYPSLFYGTNASSWKALSLSPSLLISFPLDLFPFQHLIFSLYLVISKLYYEKLWPKVFCLKATMKSSN